MKLTGKVTLITNTSQFMGPACTEEFAKEGFFCGQVIPFAGGWA
jgi:NAD(P)-dependent dehydrogenase (short-subunit alcohol dehydrogenase family)